MEAHVKVVAAGPTPSGQFEVYKDHNNRFTFFAEVKTIYESRLTWIEVSSGMSFGEVYNDSWRKIHNPIKAIFIEPGTGMVDLVELPVPHPQAVFDGLLFPISIPNGDVIYTDINSTSKKGGSCVWYYEYPEFPNGMKGFVGPGVILRRESGKITSPKTSLGEALLNITWEDELVM